MSARIPEGPAPDAPLAAVAVAAASEARTPEPLLRREPDAHDDATRDSRDGRELRAERRPVDAAAMETLLHDVPLEVSVELGRVRMPLGELAARLSPGSVIALDKAAGALLDVRVQSRLIARAEAVAIGERCGIRILELVGGNDT